MALSNDPVFNYPGYTPVIRSRDGFRRIARERKDLMNCKQETLVVNEQKPPFGAEISTDIYLWTISLSVSRNEEYSESAAREIKTVSFEELIRSMDKYQSIFWNQMHAGYCVCYPLNISQRARF